MLELKNIQKAFGANKVLTDINFFVPKNKITVIIGRSGEGKSVLLKHMMRLLKPDAGQILFNGTDISQISDEELLPYRRKMGMVFQYAALFDSLNVFDNVAFPLVEHSDMNETQIKKRVEEVLGLVGLKDIDDRLPGELSGGMRKRVGLARAIALTPEILFYDEPTTGLDPIMTDSVNRLIVKTQQELGVTSVVISHDLKAAFDIADKVALLYKGEILLEGHLQDFQKSDHPFIQHFLAGKAWDEEDLKAG